MLLTLTAAESRWKPEYAQNSPEEQAWYQRQQTTPEWRKRVGLEWYNYCCDHSDTVEAQFRKDGKGWNYRLPGEAEWKLLPSDVVQEDIPTPRGRPVLFVDATGRGLGAVCFFPGASGA